MDALPEPLEFLFRLDGVDEAQPVTRTSQEKRVLTPLFSPQHPNLPHTLRCSYRVYGDLLTVCYTAGKDRPADLSAGGEKKQRCQDPFHGDFRGRPRGRKVLSRFRRLAVRSVQTSSP
jgi:hypothetical protein